MTEPSEKSTPETFPAELRSIWSLCLISLVLAALAIAFGLSAIVDAVVAMAGEGSFGIFRLVQAFAGWAAAVIGVRWIISGARILNGVSGILRDYQALEGRARQESIPPKAGQEGLAPERAGAPEVPGAGSTRVAGKAGPGSLPGGGATVPRPADGPFLRMMAHYREHWKTYWKMGLVSAIGGWIFLCLGVLDFIDGYPAWQAGGGAGHPFLAGGISIALGAGAILVSRRFREDARTWERRLIDAGQGWEILPGEGEKPDLRLR